MIEPYVKAGLFKVEYPVASTTCVQLFSTKRWARRCARDFGGTIRRGPDHRRGETGATTHDWSDGMMCWLRLSERQIRLVGPMVRAANMREAAP